MKEIIPPSMWACLIVTLACVALYIIYDGKKEVSPKTLKIRAISYLFAGIFLFLLGLLVAWNYWFLNPAPGWAEEYGTYILLPPVLTVAGIWAIVKTVRKEKKEWFPIKVCPSEILRRAALLSKR